MTYSARVVFGFGVLAMFGLSTAVAQVAGNPGEVSKGKKTEAKPAQKGATVFIDPVTHQVRQPSAAEIGALTQGQATASQQVEPAPTMIYPAAGGVGIVLDGSTDSYMVVTKRPDGKLDMDCVTGEKAAANRLANPKPAAAKPVVAAPKKEVLDVK